MAESLFLKHVGAFERGREMHRNVIAAVADELQVTSTLKVYEPPYRLTYAL